MNSLTKLNDGLVTTCKEGVVELWFQTPLSSNFVVICTAHNHVRLPGSRGKG